MGFLKDIVADAKLRPSMDQASDDGDGITYHQIHSPTEISKQPESMPGSIAHTDLPDVDNEKEASVGATEMSLPGNNKEAVQPPTRFAPHPVAQHSEHITDNQTNNAQGINGHLVSSGTNEDHPPMVAEPAIDTSIELQSIKKMNSKNTDVAITNTQPQIEANYLGTKASKHNSVESDKSDLATSRVELSEPQQPDTFDTPSVDDVLHGAGSREEQQYSEPQQQSTINPAKDLKSNSMPSTVRDGEDVYKYNSTRQVKRLNPQAAVSLTDVESGSLGTDVLPQSITQTDVDNNMTTVLTANQDKNVTDSSLQVDYEEAHRRSNSNRSNAEPEEARLLSKKTNTNSDTDPGLSLNLSRTRTEDASILSPGLSSKSIAAKNVSNTPSVSGVEATHTNIQGTNTLAAKDGANLYNTISNKISNHMPKDTIDTLQTDSSIPLKKNKIRTDEVSVAPQTKTQTNKIYLPHPRTDDAPMLAQRVYRSPLADLETAGGEIGAAKSAAQVMGTEKSNNLPKTARTYLDSVLQRNASALIESRMSGLKQTKQIKADASKPQNRPTSEPVDKTASLPQRASVLPSSNISGGSNGIKQAQQFLVGHGLRIPSMDKASAGPAPAKPAPPRFEPPKLEIGQIDIVVEEAEEKVAPSQSVNTASQDFASCHYLRRL
jgi:hypothetical protein